MQAVKAPVRIPSSRRHSCLGPCNSPCSIDTDSTTPVNQDMSTTSTTYTAGVWTAEMPEGPSPITSSRRNSLGRTLSSCDCQACTELPDVRSSRGGHAGATNSKCSYSGYEVLEPHVEELIDSEEEKIKSKLTFHFLNPIEKYQRSRRVPWKLCVQVLKLFLVTAQLWIFADYRFGHLTYFANQEVSMHHLFIKDWDPAREVQAYPPATGKLALYTIKEFVEFLDYAVSSWATIETSSLAPLFRNSSLLLCVEHYSARNISKDLEFSLASTPAPETCISLNIDQAQKYKNIVEWMDENNFSVQWQVMHRLYLKFCLTSINLSGSSLHPGPECYRFQVKLLFDNSVHDGQVPIDLVIKPAKVGCSSVADESSFYSQFIMIFNLMVIIISATSFYLCLRSLLRAVILRMETEYILLRNYGLALTQSEKLEFLNLW